VTFVTQRPDRDGRHSTVPFIVSKLRPRGDAGFDGPDVAGEPGAPNFSADATGVVGAL